MNKKHALTKRVNFYLVALLMANAPLIAQETQRNRRMNFDVGVLFPLNDETKKIESQSFELRYSYDSYYSRFGWRAGLHVTIGSYGPGVNENEDKYNLEKGSDRYNGLELGGLYLANKFYFIGGAVVGYRTYRPPNTLFADRESTAFIAPKVTIGYSMSPHTHIEVSYMAGKVSNFSLAIGFNINWVHDAF